MRDSTTVSSRLHAGSDYAGIDFADAVGGDLAHAVDGNDNCPRARWERMSEQRELDQDQQASPKGDRHVEDRPPTQTHDGREETPLERVDRNLEELTGELRVVVTGVQVLFAFLLVVPFDTGFASVGQFERTVYFVTLVFAALAAACTIAPSAQHRFLFRHDDKPHLVFFSNRVVMVGLGFLALAMCGSLLLVATKLFGAGAGLLTTLFAVFAFGGLWFAAPMYRRRALESNAAAPSGSVRHR